MMAPGGTDNDLLKKAKELEHQAFEKNKIMLSHMPALANIVDDMYCLRCPKSSDYDNRIDLIRIFNTIAKEIYGDQKGCPVVEEFGSFLMNMFSTESDLDLSINFRGNTNEYPRHKKIRTLKTFARELKDLQSRGHVTDVELVLGARVPVLKVTDCGTGIECDLSVENRDGINKSRILLMITEIDERFPKLSFLVKAWAKAHSINSSRDGTLNSLSLISLVAFHLQNRDPPILPPFSAIFKDGIDPAAVKKGVSNLLNYGQRNKETLIELFVTLLIRLESVKTLWPVGLCASIYEGSWKFKTWNNKTRCMGVEDFVDRSENIARAVVSSEKVSAIYQCISDSLHQIQTFINDEIDGPKLRDFLFGSDQPKKNKDSVNFDQQPTKKVRLTDGLQRSVKVSSEIRRNATPVGSKKRKKVEIVGEKGGNVTPYPTPLMHQQGGIEIYKRRNTQIWEQAEKSTRDYGKSMNYASPSFTNSVPSMPQFLPNPYFAPYPIPIIPLTFVPLASPSSLLLNLPQNLYPGTPVPYSGPKKSKKIHPKRKR